MGLARKDRVIALIESPSEEQEQQDMDIDGALIDGDRMVYDFTRKREWTAPDPDNDILGDTGYGWAQDAAEKFAASRLVSEWKGDDIIIQRYRKEAMDDLTVLKRIGYGELDSDNPSFYSTVTAYKTTIPNSSSSPNGGHTVSTTRSKRYISDNAFGGNYD